MLNCVMAVSPTESATISEIRRICADILAPGDVALPPVTTTEAAVMSVICAL